jgi:hypothetical protein
MYISKFLGSLVYLLGIFPTDILRVTISSPEIAGKKPERGLGNFLVEWWLSSVTRTLQEVLIVALSNGSKVNR